MDKKTFAFIISLIGLVFSFLTPSALATQHHFPNFLSHQDTQLERCSRGQLKAFRFIHVGYAALYMERCQQINDIFAISAKRLRFVYQREIPAKAFREAAEEYLEINLGVKFDDWQQTIDQFNKGYRDIKDGDYYDLIYDPRNGLKLSLNGSQIATKENPAIGLAYFNIWFGKEPFSESLKEELLTPENL